MRSNWNYSLAFRLVSLLVLLVSVGAYGGDLKYPVSDIPEDLKADMNAVYREDELVYRILSRSKATKHVRKAITIFNEKGKDFASEVVGYDKFSRIKSISASVYNEEGKLIKKLKSSEIIDQSSFDGYSLYSDDRLKHFDLSQGIYPYTVEIEYEVEYKFLYSIPSFSALPRGKVSSQHALYELQYPLGEESLAPRHLVLNTDEKPTQTKTKDGFASLAWTFTNVKPIKPEPLGPSERQQLPLIIAAPSSFEYDGYAGEMGSWNQFGQWISSLSKGRNNLPQATKEKIRKMTENLKTPDEKIKVLYEYMQNRTRYVNISLGIGGLQPFEASVVDNLGYGDCKALSNYMISLLETIGIEAYYTLVDAGPDPRILRVNFPSHQFNHVTVFVPGKSDTIWLECTSQTKPFGYAGKFTGDRKALAITKDGAQVVWTPRYSPEQNIQHRTADVFVESKGNARTQIKTTYSGIQYENDGLDDVLNGSPDDQRKWVLNNTSIPNFDLTSFSMTNRKDKIPTAIVDISLNLNRLATVSGKRLFLTPNLMNRWTYIPEKVDERKTKVIWRSSFTDLDTIRYHIPEEIYPEFLPEPVKLNSRFGEYEASFKLDRGSVVYIRKMVMNKGEFPADSYNELVEFYKSVNKADNIKLVFLNKT